MNIEDQVKKMDGMVSQGDIVNAVKEFFSDNAMSSDYGKTVMSNKSEMVEKMEGFLGSIAKVNGITHHRTMIGNNASASEFTFDFDMKDGSSIFWHEIIRRVWNEDGLVVHEEYFNAQ